MPQSSPSDLNGTPDWKDPVLGSPGLDTASRQASKSASISTPVSTSHAEVDETQGDHFRQSTKAQTTAARAQLAAICYCFFLIGWNDGTNGPLLPRMQDFYHLSYSVVSLLFVMTCVGFIIGVLLNVYLTEKLNFGKVIMTGSLLQIIGYSLMSPAPPFPVLLLGVVINGIGRPLQESQANAYVACSRDNKSSKLGMIHAVYGLGALSAPFASTQFAQISDRKWAFHYMTSLGISVINAIALAVVFRGKSWKECLQDANQVDPQYEDRDRNTDKTGSSRYIQILLQRVLPLLALFSLVYMGVEMTIGGWTVSYIIKHRNGGPSSGYISSGFFGGMTVGRLVLLRINAKVGEKRIVCLYAAIAIALEIVIYTVPSLVVNAVAVSLVGVVLGPMYPILMNTSGSLIPPALLPGSLGWVAGTGMIGTALLPFGTGALAQRFGIASLQPFLISLTTLMLCLWSLILMYKPRKKETTLS